MLYYSRVPGALRMDNGQEAAVNNLTLSAALPRGLHSMDSPASLYTYLMVKQDLFEDPWSTEPGSTNLKLLIRATGYHEVSM